jgi:hypothetical protein
MPTREKPAIPIKEFNSRIVSVPAIAWARLAAFIDGEGSIVIERSRASGKRRTTSYQLGISITNTSPLLIGWLSGNFGGSVHSKHLQGGMRPIWSWHLREKQANAVLQKCLPYFIIKREQAEIGIAFCALKSNSAPVLFTRVSEESLQKREELRNKIHLLNSPNSAERAG